MKLTTKFMIGVVIAVLAWQFCKFDYVEMGFCVRCWNSEVDMEEEPMKLIGFKQEEKGVVSLKSKNDVAAVSDGGLEEENEIWTIMIGVVIAVMLAYVGGMNLDETEEKHVADIDEVSYVKTVKVLPVGMNDDPEVEYLHTIEA